MVPVTALLFVVPGGCFVPDGARITPTEGDGEDCEDRAPLIEVWTAGGGGRFIFWCGGAGFVAIAVAILSVVAKAELLRALQMQLS